MQVWGTLWGAAATRVAKRACKKKKRMRVSGLDCVITREILLYAESYFSFGVGRTYNDWESELHGSELVELKFGFKLRLVDNL